MVPGYEKEIYRSVMRRQESIGVETYDSQARTHIRCQCLFSFAYCKHCLNKRDIDGLPTQPVCSFTLHIQTGCLVLTVWQKWAFGCQLKNQLTFDQSLVNQQLNNNQISPKTTTEIYQILSHLTIECVEKLKLNWRSVEK